MLKTEVRSVTEDRLFLLGAICDNCGKEVDPVLGPLIMDRPQHVPFKNMLILTPKGGYGAYFDGHGDDVMFCENCAASLCRLFPCIAKAINGVD